ncbi:hypothetical protein [Flagellimonas sp.]|uniref:hypothetical protein n=1 Tax=Flagellimonas sp. TaxID=2058762 RepID=UPI003F4A01B6
MKLKKYVIYALLIYTGAINAQSYVGYLTDNYNGVHGVLSNPANIADSRLKLEVNLAGASVFFSNDYIGFNLSDAFGNVDTLFDNAEKFPMENNAMALNTDILGPAVLLTINEKNALSVFMRGRLFFNALDINGETLDKEGGFDETQDFTINEGNLSAVSNLWAELGVSYARVLLNNEAHFLKAGLTLKYMQGSGNAYIYSEDP